MPTHLFLTHSDPLCNAVRLLRVVLLLCFAVQIKFKDTDLLDQFPDQVSLRALFVSCVLLYELRALFTRYHPNLLKRREPN